MLFIKVLLSVEQSEEKMISLVMATYNGLEYISEQLDSLKNQTLLPDEVLIFDDKSTDGTYEYILKYIENHNLYNWNVYRNEENKGYSLNFSGAIEAAQGDLIFLCDQDDIWYTNKIEKMVEIMESNEKIALLASNVHPIYNGRKPQKVHYQKYWGNLIKINRKASWIKPARPGCTMCFRKELKTYYREICSKEYPHDCLLWGISVLQGNAYIYNHDTIDFRRHDSNASSRGGRDINYRIKGLQNEIQIINKVRNFLCKDNPKLYKFLLIQETVYKLREEILLNLHLMSAILMVRYILYYGQTRFWMTDIYYIIKKKMRRV